MIAKLGKKGKEWRSARAKRIKELAATGKYVIIKTLLYGNCTDCGRYKCLDLDHIEGRSGDEPHRMENLEAVCRICHIKRHTENHMKQKTQKPDTAKPSKAGWQKIHPCKGCKATVSTLLCPYCGKVTQ